MHPNFSHEGFIGNDRSEFLESVETFAGGRRRALDERLARHLDLVGPPPRTGWLRAIREVLAMSQFELGLRAGVSQPRVAQIEQGEVSGRVEFRTVQHMAEALGCTFAYVVAPRAPLEAMVRSQALHKAHGDEALAQELIDRPGLWNPKWPGRGRPPIEAP